MKDLPDLALLASVEPIGAVELRDALNATFTFRDTHELPSELPDPPPSWEPVYARMAAEDDLAWKTLDKVFDAVRRFLSPVLRDEVGQWDHDAWGWRETD